MRKAVISMHISLDGFVAGPNGEIDWILVDEEMFDYGSKLTDNADTALYGRVTYEMMEGYWPTAAEQPTSTRHDIEHSKWYNRVSKIVLSSSMKGHAPDNTTIINDNIDSEIMKVKQRPGKDIIIFGSPGACHSLMQHDLVDDYWLFVNPVLLGKGIPLFGNILEISKLKLLSTKTFQSGVICLHYERDRVVEQIN
jgi:dihydrofolate reductase